MVSSDMWFSGNIAVDLGILVCVLVAIGHLLGQSAYQLGRAAKGRKRLRTMRSTLEMKSGELAALRQILHNARREAAAHRELLSEERRDQLSLACFMADGLSDSDHPELEEQLREAASRPRFDA